MKTTVAEVAGKQTVQVVSLGAMALDSLFRSTEWQVIAAYRRSLYCRDNQGNVICIGQNEIGQGPFTLLCSAASDWPGEVLLVSSRLRVRKKHLLMEGSGVIFDMHGASVWRKSLHTVRGAENHLISDIKRLAVKTACAAPAESLGVLASDIFPVNLQRPRSQAGPLIETLHQRFLAVINEVRQHPLLLPEGGLDTSIAEGLKPLMGLGPGLTPSGDDFLAGIVMGLFKTGHHHEAAMLAHYFCQEACDRVTDIGLAFYRALAEGLVAEPYHRFLAALGTGNSRTLDPLMKQVSNVGGTSGWDTIAGILFGISLGLPSMQERQDDFREAVC